MGKVESGRDIVIVSEKSAFAGMGGVNVYTDAEAKGSVLLDGGESVIRIGGKVEGKGDVVVKGNIEVMGDVESDGRVVLSSTLGPSGLFKVGGKLKGKYGVFSEGNLEVECVPLSLGKRKLIGTNGQ